MCLNPEQAEEIEHETKYFTGAQTGAWLSDSRINGNQHGFTLVELIVTIVIIGILAVVVAPRFTDGDVFQSRGFADQVQASLRYAQKAAIAQRRNVCVAFTASTIAVSAASISGADEACDTNLKSPTGQSAYLITAPSDITFSAIPAGFKFDSLGRPWVGASSVGTSGVIVVGSISSVITVETETGYVH